MAYVDRAPRDAVAAVAQRHWFALVAIVLFAGPALASLAQQEWSSEQGAAGPIILASGLWLLWREAKETGFGRAAADAPRWAGAAVLLAPLLLSYVAARIVGMVWLEWLSAYCTIVVIAAFHFGWRTLARLWFPLVYLLFLVPPPHGLIGPLTDARKLWLSVTSVDILSYLGFDVAYNGTTLYVDQYELRIADACAGMNSLISLLAIGLFYIYVLHRSDWRYAGLLALLALPIAMIANLARILLVLVATHYLGVETADGIVHDVAGIFMFLVALACLMGADVALAPLRRISSRA
ncbi:MAG TPA: exosortase [Sphingomonas sp.]|jgi:exosortase|nr:exosortase [Sphingomonas sp.]